MGIAKGSLVIAWGEVAVGLARNIESIGDWAVENDGWGWWRYCCLEMMPSIYLHRKIHHKQGP